MNNVLYPYRQKSCNFELDWIKIELFFTLVCEEQLWIFYTLLLQPKPENAITIGVSARVLFNMEKEQQIYEQQGMEEYIKYQVEHETQPFSPGPAFSFVKVRETHAHYKPNAE